MSQATPQQYQPPAQYQQLHDPERAQPQYKQPQYPSNQQQYQQPPYQSYSHKEPYARDGSGSSIYPQLRLGLRIASGLFCIALIISCIPPLTVSAGRSGWQFAYYGPPAFIALIWDIFDVISARKRQGVSPVHPYLRIGIELALWVTLLAVAIARGSDGNGGNQWWYGGSSSSDSARAALAFAILLMLVHLACFGLDCHALYQKRQPQPATPNSQAGLGIQNVARPPTNQGPPELETPESTYGELETPSTRPSVPMTSPPRTELESTSSQRPQYAQLDSQTRPAELPVEPVEMPTDNYATDKEAGAVRS